MHVLPTSLSKTDQRSLRIQWSDGKVFEYPFGKLRDACPCATCKEKRKSELSKPKNTLAILAPGEAAPLDILEMRPIGNYAYNITFSDGHSSGLFPMELLRELGSPTLDPEDPSENAAPVPQKHKPR